MNLAERIYFPSGYPYLLFVNDNDGNYKFFVSVSPEQASKQIYNKGSLDAVKMGDLITGFGHQSTHNFLKKFGDQWMTKEGMIFFKENKAIGL